MKKKWQALALSAMVMCGGVAHAGAMWSTDFGDGSPNPDAGTFDSLTFSSAATNSNTGGADRFLGVAGRGTATFGVADNLNEATELAIGFWANIGSGSGTSAQLEVINGAESHIVSIMGNVVNPGAGVNGSHYYWFTMDNGGASTLLFKNLGSSPYIRIDDLTVSVPEPGSLALALPAFALVLGARRRRRAA